MTFVQGLFGPVFIYYDNHGKTTDLKPKSPPSLKWLYFLRQPPLGVLSLKGQRKLEAALKLGPTVKISWIKSSMQIKSFLPATMHTDMAYSLALGNKEKVSMFYQVCWLLNTPPTCKVGLL